MGFLGFLGTPLGYVLQWMYDLFGSYGWAPMGPNEVYQALESCKFTLPEAPLTHQWVEDEEGLNALHDAIVDYVSLFHGKA